MDGGQWLVEKGKVTAKVWDQGWAQPWPRPEGAKRLLGGEIPQRQSKAGKPRAMVPEPKIATGGEVDFPRRGGRAFAHTTIK